MDLTAWFTESGLKGLGAFLAVATPRLLAALTVNPIFGGGAVSGQTRFAVVGALTLIPAPFLWPEVLAILAGEASWPVYLALVAKETLLGLLIGWVSGIVFWAVQSAGFLMDNQRGASMATGPNPLSSDETSPMGSMLFQGVVAVFFLTGGFLSFIRLIWASYSVWPLASFWPEFGSPAGALFFVALVDWLSLQTLLLAGPVVAACLLTDVSLGLVNRFASQLNVYVLAMPIKSGLASFILVSYYVALLNLSPGLFASGLGFLRRIFGLS
jgi:type III secretion protein T